MSDLTGRDPSATFGGLLNIDNSNDGIDATLRVVQDGKGTEGPFKLSTTGQELKNTATLSGATPSGSDIAKLDTGNMRILRGVTEITAGATYTVLFDDDIIAVNLTVAGAITITLPAATGSRRQLVVKDAKGDLAPNTFTVDGDGSETIDGSATYVNTSRYASITLVDWASGKWVII